MNGAVRPCVWGNCRVGPRSAESIWGTALENLRTITAYSPRIRPSRWLISASLAVVLLGGFSSGGVRAESLHGALAGAYTYNPRLEAERAKVRADDEEVPRAKSGYRPRINATADIGATSQRTNPKGGPASRDTREPRGFGVSLDQNVFDGFTTTNNVNAAEAFVRAQRAELHRVEQEVLGEAVIAYMDVVRDEAIVRLRENNVRVLTSDLRATQDRFNAGEVTRTDVAQSRARRADAVSDLDLARANLQTSRANYERIIGRPPSRLQKPQVPERFLPKSLAEAQNLAVNENPRVIQALYREQEARYVVDSIFGELLPQFSVSGGYQKRFRTSAGINDQDDLSVVGLLNVPIYQGGEVKARVRQAKHVHVQRIQEVAQQRTEVRELAVAAWAELGARRAKLRSDKTSVEANQIALAGVREEEKVGQRTLLDVLNAEQELLNSQVTLVETERDLVVSAYAVLAATGRLTSKELGLTNRVYDPEAHYFDVRRKWFGISITHQDGRREHVNVWKSHGEGRTYK